MNYYVEVLKNYANFEGRARRKEFLMFILFNSIIIIALLVLTILLQIPFILPLYILGIIIPTYAVRARRMHDVGVSGWYMLIPIYGFILACTESQYGPNEYGPNPKGDGESEFEQIGTSLKY